MKKLFFLIFFFVSCVSQVDRPGHPSCCQSLYDVIYLNQKAKIPLDVGSLLDCCRKQQKYNFCMDATDTENCIRLMKDF